MKALILTSLPMRSQPPPRLAGPRACTGPAAIDVQTLRAVLFATGRTRCRLQPRLRSRGRRSARRPAISSCRLQLQNFMLHGAFHVVRHSMSKFSSRSLHNLAHMRMALFLRRRRRPMSPNPKRPRGPLARTPRGRRRVPGGALPAAGAHPLPTTHDSVRGRGASTTCDFWRCLSRAQNLCCTGAFDVSGTRCQSFLPDPSMSGSCAWQMAWARGADNPNPVRAGPSRVHRPRGRSTRANLRAVLFCDRATEAHPLPTPTAELNTLRGRGRPHGPAISAAVISRNAKTLCCTGAFRRRPARVHFRFPIPHLAHAHGFDVVAELRR